jgi:hypothetical protein
VESSVWYEDALARAKAVALSYHKCVEVMTEKAAELHDSSYSVDVELIRLWPGWREVILKIMFPDGTGLRAQVDLEHEIVNWVKNYW